MSIGVDVRVQELTERTLLPGIQIESGRLVVDPSKLVWPGDLLHEAGHLAIVPAALRPTIGGELPVDPLVQHAGEAEATAWAYAALVTIGLPPEVLFHAGGYHGKSQALIFSYTNGVYLGAAGLGAAGLAATPEEVRSAGLPGYPNMRRWLRA